MADFDKAALVRLVRSILVAKGWSSARLSRELGVAPSTVTRAVDPEVPHMLNAKTVQKLIKIASEISVSLSDGIMSADRESRISSAWDNPPIVVPVPVIGYIKAGTWINESSVTAFSYPPVAIGHDSLPSDIKGFLMDPSESDEMFLPGSLVLASEGNINSAGLGDIVVIRRRIDTPGYALFETSLWNVSEIEGEIVFEGRSPRSVDNIKIEVIRIGQSTDFVGLVVGNLMTRSGLGHAPRPLAMAGAKIRFST